MKPRDTYKYRLKRGNKLVRQHPYGITSRSLLERERELQQQFPGAQAEKVGNITTREGALQWERKLYKRRGRKG